MRSFILRSEVVQTTPQDAARRAQIISELSDADLDRVAGAVQDCHNDWNPNTGGDGTCHSDGWDSPP